MGFSSSQVFPHAIRDTHHNATPLQWVGNHCAQFIQFKQESFSNRVSSLNLTEMVSILRKEPDHGSNFVSFFLRRAEFVKCKQISCEKINGGEIQPSWVSLESQFDTCNDILSDCNVMHFKLKRSISQTQPFVVLGCAGAGCPFQIVLLNEH